MASNRLLLSALVAPFALLACSSSSTTASSSNGGAGGTSSHAASSHAASSSVASSGNPGTGGSAGTGGASGACINAADGAILAAEDIKTIVQTCAQNNLGQEPATKKCIKDSNNPDAGASMLLSDGCTTCFDDEVQCIFSKCLSQCATAPTSQPCSDCRKANCDPAFIACSGLPSN